MSAISRRKRRETNIWPGFVDALATLLVVVLFLLMVFVLAQLFLNRTLSGRNAELKNLSGELSELSEMLAFQEAENADLRTRLTSSAEKIKNLQLSLDISRNEYETARHEIDQLKSTIGKTRERLQASQTELSEKLEKVAQLQHDIAALKALKNKLQTELTSTSNALWDERELSRDAQAQAALLSQQILELKDELTRLADALDAADALTREQKAHISQLGNRLNKALATRVAELRKFSSEFFGRLRKVLGKRHDIRIEGDRFVFQSEVLFASGSATLGEQGKQTLEKLATTLLEISGTIPDDINWVLRVDGHTDRLPIKTDAFPSNWELSAARALAVVEFLISRGLPPNRLAATAFAQYQPIEKGQTAAALKRNRRIEFKITQR